MTTTLNLLCAGAAMGLVRALQAAFEAEHRTQVVGRFGAVGAMKEALLAGEPCDVMLVTASMVAQLVEEGLLRAGSAVALGRVHTGIAVPAAAARPGLGDAPQLKAALLAAEAVYVPDPQRATAGIHFAKVLDELGIAQAVRSRWQTYPNGATAMRALAVAGRGIGCTQVSEILYTEGVVLAGALPAPFELATVYTAAVSARAAQPELAARWVAHLGGAQAHEARARAGFED